MENLRSRVAFVTLGSGISWTLLDGIWAQVSVFAALSPQGLALPTQLTMAGQVVLMSIHLLLVINMSIILKCCFSGITARQDAE